MNIPIVLNIGSQNSKPVIQKENKYFNNLCTLVLLKNDSWGKNLKKSIEGKMALWWQILRSQDAGFY